MHFGQTDFGRSQCNAVVTTQGDFQSTTQGSTVNRGNDGFARRFHITNYRHQAGLAHALGKFGDIGTGNKGSALANQHHGFDAVVTQALLNAGFQARTNRLIEGVYGGIIDFNQAYCALL